MKQTIKTLFITFILILFVFLATVSFAEEASSDNVGYQYYYKQLDPVQKEYYDFLCSLPQKTSTYTLVLHTDLSNYMNEKGILFSSTKSIETVLFEANDALKSDFPKATAWWHTVPILDNWSFSDNSISFSIERSKHFNETDQANADHMLNVIIANANPNWTRFEKSVYIADVVANSMIYNWDYQLFDPDAMAFSEYLNHNYLSYVCGTATCEGYSAIYKLLADELGLPCVIISSRTHAFLYVQMDDDCWYAIDPQETTLPRGSDNLLGQAFDEYGFDVYEPSMSLEHPIIEDGNYVPSIDQPYYERITISDLRAEVINSNEPKYTYSINADGSTVTLTSYRGPQIGDLVVPDTIDGYPVTAIGDSAYANCKGFTGTLYIPDSVVTIGNNAFIYCEGLSGSLSLPSSLTTIGSFAFKDCKNLSGSLIFPDTIKTIGKNAFRNCWNLSGSLLLPDSITSIGEYAFIDCFNLNGSIYIPASLNTWDSLISDAAFSEVLVSPDNPYFSSRDGILYSKDMKTLLFCPRTKTGEVTIPDGVERLASLAFAGCANITKLTFPASLNQFDYRCCFDLSGLKTPLSIPSTILRVGSAAFEASWVEATITIPGNVDISSNSSFCGMKGCTRIVICDGIEVLPAATFSSAYSPLREVFIPPTVKQIGHNCFEYCDNLTICGFPGTFAEEYAKNNNFTFVAYEESVKLNYDEYTLDVDGKYRSNEIQLSASDYMGNDISETCAWTSSDDSIVTVTQSGFVRAVAQGKATITVTTNDGRSAYCIIYSARQIASFDISTPFSPFINVGDRSGLYLLPETDDGLTLYDGITWQTSDSSIVRIVTKSNDCARIGFLGKKVGRCTITVSSPDGKSEEREIIVLDRPQETIYPNTNIRLIYGFPGYDVVQSAPTFLPAGTGTMLWGAYSLDSNVASPYSDYYIHAWGLGKTKVIYELSNSEKIYYNVSCEKPFSLIMPDCFLPAEDSTPENPILSITCAENYSCNATVEINDLITETPLITWSSDSPAIEINSQTGEMFIKQPGRAMIRVQVCFANATFEECVEIHTEVLQNVLTLPNGLTTIESEAFSNLSNVDAIRIPASVHTIADNAFSNSDIVLLIPRGSEWAEWARLKGIRYIEE